jgi:hypothetical protein
MSAHGPGSPLALRMKPLPLKSRSNVVDAKIETQLSFLPGQTTSSIIAPDEPRAPPLKLRPSLSAATPPNALAVSTESSIAPCSPHSHSAETAHSTAAAPLANDSDQHSTLQCDDAHAASSSPQQKSGSGSAGHLPFFYCKISAKNLPQFDVFSSSDPVCFVSEASSRRIIRAQTLFITLFPFDPQP